MNRAKVCSNSGEQNRIYTFSVYMGSAIYTSSEL